MVGCVGQGVLGCISVLQVVVMVGQGVLGCVSVCARVC